jgi:uncharacterized protein YbaP (TraB family)
VFRKVSNAMPMSKLAAPVAALATLVAAAAAKAEPAMWVVKDEDSTIYLLGTIHLLKPEMVWRTPKVAKAIADAKDLTIEILGADDPQAAIPIIQKLGIDPTRSLGSKLSPKDRAKLYAAAKDSGLPDGMIDALRPWYAAVVLSIGPMTKAGYDPKSGVDNLVQAGAKAQGDTIQAFETLEQQLTFFANLPEPLQLEFLRQTLEDYDEGPGELDAITRGWLAGDTASLEKTLLEDMRKEAPELYEVLIVQRNADWAAKIEAKLKSTAGVSLIAVGAGHLVGPDSVQALLKKRGVASARY